MHTRRCNVRIFAVGALVAVLTAAPGLLRATTVCDDPNPLDPPNIVLIVADDLGQEALPFFSPPIHWLDENDRDDNAGQGYFEMRRDENRLVARMLAAEQECGAPLGTFTRSTPPGTPYPVIPADAAATPPGDHTYSVLNANCMPPPAGSSNEVLPGFGGLRALADQGVIFNRFYVPASVCAPSRASMLTGRGPPRTGIGGNQCCLDTDEVTIAEYLRQGCGDPCTGSGCAPCFGTRGADGICRIGGQPAPCFRTGLVGKWHLGDPGSPLTTIPDKLPWGQGFEEVVTHRKEKHSYRGSQRKYCSRPLLYLGPVENAQPLGPSHTPECTPDEAREEADEEGRRCHGGLNHGMTCSTHAQCEGGACYAGEEICCDRFGLYRAPGERSLDEPACDADTIPECAHTIRAYAQLARHFISRHRREPFFLVVTHNVPHASIRVQGRTKQKYHGVERTPGAPYWAAIEEYDASVGRILATLATERDALDRPLIERTLVLLFSDHGTRFGGDTWGDPRPRGGKKSMYEGGINVGLLASACGQAPTGLPSTGILTNHIVSSVDVFATVAEAAGIPLTALVPQYTFDLGATNHHVEGESFYSLLRAAGGTIRNFTFARLTEAAIAMRQFSLTETVAWPPTEPLPTKKGVCGFVGENTDHMPVRRGSCRRCATSDDCLNVPLSDCLPTSNATIPCTGNECCPQCLGSAWKLITDANPTVPTPNALPDDTEEQLFDLSTNPEERLEVECELTAAEIWRDLKCRVAKWKQCTDLQNDCDHGQQGLATPCS